MKIVIAHLYYDLLNLYGESGNVKALKKYLENQGIEVVIENKSVNEKLEFNKYDFVYIGAGTENNLSIALNHLKEYEDDIKEYIKKDKFMLITGTAIELFGKSIEDDETTIEGLKIFDYEIKREQKRLVCESVLRSNIYDFDIIGFQNRCGLMYANKHQAFEVLKGYAENMNSDEEGVQYKNVLATYIVGPLLARNPMLLNKICEELILSKDKKFKIKEIDMTLEIEAYEFDKNRYMNK